MNKKKLAIFDFDNTILKTDSTLIYLIEIFKFYPKTLIYIPVIIFYSILHIFKIVNRTKLKEVFYKPLEMLNNEKYKDFSLSLADRCMHYVKEGAIEEIKNLTDKHYEIIIISASPEFYIKHISSKLGIKNYIGTKLILDKGKIKIDGLNCKGEEKINRLNLIFKLSDFDLKNSITYSDSYSDLPILKLVGNGYLVDKKKWRVIKKI